VGLTIHVIPPGASNGDAGSSLDGTAAADGGAMGEDLSCLGVVGFEVTVSSDGDNVTNFALNNDIGPVLTPESCQLSQPVTVQDLDPELPATITVSGYDGARKRLVAGTTTVANLHGTTATIALAGTTTQLVPVVAIDREPLFIFANVSRDQIKSMALKTRPSPLPFIAVDAASAQPFFSVDPTAYASNALLAGGGSAGLAVNASFLLNDGTTMVNVTNRSMTLVWKGDYYEIAQQ